MEKCTIRINLWKNSISQPRSKLKISACQLQRPS